MTDKQIIDMSHCIYHNNGKCTNSAIGQCNCANVASCYYKEYKRTEQEYKFWLHQAKLGLETTDRLAKELEEKEQECEELKEINSTLLEYRKHSTTCQECYEDGLEDGKTSNKELRKLRKTLTKIKEIAENNKHSVLCFTAFEGDVIEVNNKPMAVILQKINEVEDDKNNN